MFYPLMSTPNAETEAAKGGRVGPGFENKYCIYGARKHRVRLFCQAGMPFPPLAKRGKVAKLVSP